MKQEQKSGGWIEFWGSDPESTPVFGGSGLRLQCCKLLEQTIRRVAQHTCIRALTSCEPPSDSA